MTDELKRKINFMIKRNSLIKRLTNKKINQTSLFSNCFYLKLLEKRLDNVLIDRLTQDENDENIYFLITCNKDSDIYISPSMIKRLELDYKEIRKDYGFTSDTISDKEINFALKLADLYLSEETKDILNLQIGENENEQ